MKTILMIVVLLMGIGAYAQQDMKDMPGMNMPTQKKQASKATSKKTAKPTSKVIYTCPMHPQVQKRKPGQCPICGMELVKKTVKVTPAKQVASTKKTAASKPKASAEDMQQMLKEMKGMVQEMKDMMQEMKMIMHSQRDSNLQVDTGGMVDMGEQLNADTAKSVEKVIYTCVMHPQIQQDKPGKCPICGMTLIKKTIKTAPSKGSGMKGMDMHGMKATDHKAPGIETTDPSNQVRSGVVIQPAKTVRYDLYVKDTIVNYTGKQKRAIAINGSIPAPTLTFTEGDTAEIYLHNMLKEETSLHWHGVILPNVADGIPFLTTAPIHPGETHLYKFRVVQSGTYWYHSHSALQEQVGMYGALIFKRPGEQNAQQTSIALSMNGSMKMESGSPSNRNGTVEHEKHLNLVLSEWADENPNQTQRRLRTGNDWMSIKKGSTQSYSEAITQGYLKTKLQNEWKRMKAMDVSDDWYQKFLVNGKPESGVAEFKAGDKVTLHIVNAGASTYFWLGYAGGKITVIGNDGNDIVPVQVDRLIIAPAETYDLLVTIPGSMSYEFRATSEDRTGASSLWLGAGMQMPAPRLPHLKYFEGMKMMNAMMNTNGTMKKMEMQMSLQQMDMNAVMYPEMTRGTGDNDKASGANNNHQTSKAGEKKDAMPGMDMAPSPSESAGGEAIVTLNYDMLRSPVKTSLPEGTLRVLKFTLTGNMNRYLWTLDNKTVTETDRILINKGETVRMIINNNSMMRHPMHLHGHDFRVLNSQGEYSPLKNVIDIMPMETDTVEFAANQSGNWFFHCHILFHMMAGMGRVFTYANSPANPELPNAEDAYKKFKHNKDQNMKHLMVRAGLESNGTDGEAMLSSNRYALLEMWHLGTKPHHGYESETMLGRYVGVNQWWLPYVGFDYHYKMVEGNLKDQADYKNLLGQVSNKNNRKTFIVGVQYLTPWLMYADARIDGDGKVRLQLSREDIPVTPRLRFNLMGNTDKEYAVGFRYIVSKWFALSTHYDSDMGLGAGVTLTY